MRIFNYLIFCGIIISAPVLAVAHCGKCGVGDETHAAHPAVVCESGKKGEECVQENNTHSSSHEPANSSQKDSAHSAEKKTSKK